MPKKKAYVRLTEQGKVMPGSMIVSKSNGVPKNGPYKEIITNLCCGDTPFSVTSIKQKAWVCYDGNGEIIPGSLVVGPTYPQDRRNWREVKTGYSNPETITIVNPSSGPSNGSVVSFSVVPLYVGQTFTLPKTGSLQNIILGLVKTGSPVFNIQLVIYEVIAGVPTNTIKGISAKVASSTVTNIAGATVTFTFSNTILPAGQYLFIASYVDVITHGGGNGIEYSANTNNLYSGGALGYTLTANSGSTWDPNVTPGWDMLSQVNYLS
jgi:hypothetical protein